MKIGAEISYISQGRRLLLKEEFITMIGRYDSVKLVRPRFLAFYLNFKTTSVTL